MNLSIWNDNFWLPENTTWNDFSKLEQNGVHLPKIQHLIYVYPLAALLYIARLCFEYSIAQPIGRLFGIREYQLDKQRINQDASNHLKTSDKQKSKRISTTKMSPLAKFSESTWRFTFYLTVFLYGIVVLKNVKYLKYLLFVCSIVFINNLMFDFIEKLVMGYASLLVKLSKSSIN